MVFPVIFFIKINNEYGMIILALLTSNENVHRGHQHCSNVIRILLVEHFHPTH